MCLGTMGKSRGISSEEKSGNPANQLFCQNYFWEQIDVHDKTGLGYILLNVAIV